MGVWDWAMRAFGAVPDEPTPEVLRTRTVRLRSQDIFGQATAAGLTPVRYAAALRLADAGYITSLVQILRGIEQRDLHLQGILGTRKLSLSGTEYLVQPGETDNPKATQAAEFVDDVLRSVPDIERVFLELLDGIYQPLGAQEIVWAIDGGKAIPAGIEWVDPGRFRYTTTTDTDANALGELRILLGENDTTGERLAAGKYIIHRPPQMAVYPWQAGLGRGLGWAYVLGAYALKDWATSAERDAQPIRTATMSDQAGDDDWDAVEEGLAALGTQAYAMFPDGTDFTLHPPAGSPEMFERLLAWLNALKTKSVLGHAGSADSTAGRLGGEDTADAVRQDILEADAKALANTLRRDLLTPLVKFNLGDDVPIPRLRFDVGQAEDLDGLATRIEILNRSGLAIPADWTYETFGIPKPEPGEDVLEAPASGGGGLPF